MDGEVGQGLGTSNSGHQQGRLRVLVEVYSAHLGAAVATRYPTPSVATGLALYASSCRNRI